MFFSKFFCNFAVRNIYCNNKPLIPMRIIITERQEKKLKEHIIKEAECDQNMIIFDYLDKNFIRADYTDDKDGEPQKMNAVVWLDSKRQPYKTISVDRLFYLLQDKFSSLTSDKDIRDKRIKDIVDAWINKRYNKTTGNILS